MIRQPDRDEALNPMACDCDTCEPRISVTRLADAGAASFFIGMMLALIFALATRADATVADLLMLIGCAS